MIKNYLLTAFRNILRHKIFSLLNIVGLALSMSVCLLIILIIMDQYKYDNFHENKGRIYRVLTNNEMADEIFTLFASTAYPVAGYLEDNYPIVERAATIKRFFGGGDGRAADKVIPIETLHVDEDFLRMFNFPLRGTDPLHALEEPNSIILTEETARKFFGNSDPMGQSFSVDSIGEYIVAGIIPENELKSHIQFDALVSVKSLKKDLSENWGNIYSSYAYVLLKEGALPGELNEAFERMREERYSDDPEHDFSFSLQKLGDIVPGPLLGNEIGFYLPRMVILFMVVLALVLILTSAFNYTNMSLAKGLTRAREIGVRKVSGALRSDVLTQFLIESVLSSIFALILAYVFLQFLAPAFEGMKFMSFLEISPEENIKVYLWFLVFAILTGVVAGLLPAFYMSSFNPIAVFKDTFGIRIFSRMFLRKFLIVAQFSVSIILFITIVLLYRQLRYYMNTDYGFAKENILNVDLQGNNWDRVAAEFSYIPDVKDIAWSSHLPAMGNMWNDEAWLDDKEEKFDLSYFQVDESYIDVLELNLLAGRNFPENRGTGGEKYIILNETAVESFGFPDIQSSLQQTITIDDSMLLEVIGIVKDYHYFGMFSKIGAMGLRNNPGKFKYAHLSVVSKDIPRTMSRIEKAWDKADPEREFKGQFMDDEIRAYYELFGDILWMVGVASLLAIIIACMGLFGMVTYSTESRIKEIGIRKAMGAKSRAIAFMISKSYIRLIGIALLVALPVSYFGNNLWLQNIAYRVNFGVGTLLSGALFIVVVSFLTILSQTMRAARQDPVKSLRYE
ncbi:ABC transporter permease [Bacteroidota bacterium]